MTQPAEGTSVISSTEPDQHLLFINGRWVPALEQGDFTVTNPATGAVIARVADGGAGDALAALDAACDAAASWAATPARRRGEILRAAFDRLIERREEFASLMTAEMGKPYAEALAEVSYGAEFLRWFAEEAPRVAGRYGPNPEGTGHVLISHQPVGPCYLVTPWNFPLAMATRKIAPALAAGCTAVLKPADLTPLTTIRLTELLAEVGLPAGVLNVVPTTNPAAVSEALLNDPRLRKISFTGSTPVGRELMAKASRNVLRMSMEL
ncbi:MAG: aldehyde dehydrogenase family protein, partial [Aeromicrobium sp.]